MESVDLYCAAMADDGTTLCGLLANYLVEGTSLCQRHAYAARTHRPYGERRPVDLPTGVRMVRPSGVDG